MKECRVSRVEDNSSNLPTKQTYLFKGNCCMMECKSKEMFLEHTKVRCTECSLEFDSCSKMLAHRQNSHAYKCHKCNLTVDNKSGLNKHLVRVHEAVHTCCKCGMDFKTISEMTKHSLEAHGNVRPFKCKMCDKMFKTKAGLTFHASTTCKRLWEKNFTKMSGTASDTSSDLKKSISSVANQKTHSYDGQTKPFKRKEEALNEPISPNENAFVCKLCTKTFNTKESLTTHICDLEQCSLCMMTFSSKQQLQEHMKLHNIKEGHRVCLECEITFPSKEKHGEHMRTYHQGVAFPCEKCKKIFGNKSELEMHKCSEVAYSKYNSVPFCEKCNLEFKSWTDANSHRNKTHVYVCAMCSKRFMSQNTLTRHMKECKGFSVEASTSSDLDTDEKIHLHKCSQCTVFFKSNDLLVEHMKMCVMKDLSRCPECGLQFDSLSEMQAHMRNSHAYKCDKCMVTFANRSEFDKHAASVHAESIYNCLKCGMGFRKMSQVMKHSLEAHNINPFKNDKVGKMGVRKSRKGLRLHTSGHSVTMENCPLVCNLCQMQFTGHEDFMHHMNAQHVVPCILCGDSFKDSSELWRHYAVKHGEGSEMVLETSAEDAAERIENLNDVASRTSDVQQMQYSMEKTNVDEAQSMMFSSTDEISEGTPNLGNYHKENGTVSRIQNGESISNVKRARVWQYDEEANSNLLRKVKTEPDYVGSKNALIWHAGSSEEAESSETEFILPD